jgi:hypothetical protein
MSRINLTPKIPNHEVVVGFDPPLQTFFAQVYPPEPDDENADHAPLMFKAQWTREEVLDVIDTYAANDQKTQKVRQAILMDLDPGRVVAQ